MENYKLQTGAGDMFQKVAERAHEIAVIRNVTVEFDFNDIKCLVNDKTVLDWLYRDYCNAHVMEWNQVGADCKMMYDADTELELRTRQLEQAKRWKRESDERDRKEKIEKEKVDNELAGVELDVIPEKKDEYAEYVKNNTKDGYSRAVIDYSEAWGKLMQLEIAKGKEVKDIANDTQKGLGYLGITGFQYGCAVKGLAYFWTYGEELRKWHNKEYGHEGNGVVNPAVLTITT